jgi:hypothetical protein
LGRRLARRAASRAGREAAEERQKKEIGGSFHRRTPKHGVPYRKRKGPEFVAMPTAP